jgi:hypothetical protein
VVRMGGSNARAQEGRGGGHGGGGVVGNGCGDHGAIAPVLCRTRKEVAPPFATDGPRELDSLGTWWPAVMQAWCSWLLVDLFSSSETTAPALGGVFTRR